MLTQRVDVSDALVTVSVAPLRIHLGYGTAICRLQMYKAKVTPSRMSFGVRGLKGEILQLFRGAPKGNNAGSFEVKLLAAMTCSRALISKSGHISSLRDSLYSPHRLNRLNGLPSWLSQVLPSELRTLI